MLMRLFARSADKLDPIDAEYQELQSWSGECSTVVFSSISLVRQPVSSIAPEGYCGSWPLRGLSPRLPCIHNRLTDNDRVSSRGMNAKRVA